MTVWVHLLVRAYGLAEQDLPFISFAFSPFNETKEDYMVFTHQLFLISLINLWLMSWGLLEMR